MTWQPWLSSRRREWFPNRDGKFNVGESTGIWAVRYILMARAVWLGYNVW